MDETPEMRARVLNLAGETAQFLAGPAKVLPGVALSKLYHGELSPYSTSLQQFVVQTSTKNVVDLNIADGSQFTLADDQFRYTFKVSSVVPDLTGWSQLDCQYVSREAL